MIIRGEDDLERLQADGKITPGDADEVRTYMDFLRAVVGIPTQAKDRTPEQQARFMAIYHEHYPEYAPKKEDQS